MKDPDTPAREQPSTPTGGRVVSRDGADQPEQRAPPQAADAEQATRSTSVAAHAGPAEEEKPAAATSSTSFQSAVQTLTTVVPPVTLFTALLFYFGWARTASQADYLGIDESVLGMSTRDYLMRSISSLYLPIACLAVIGLALLWLHAILVGLMERDGAEETVRRGVRSEEDRSTRPKGVELLVRVLSYSWLTVPTLALVAGRFPLPRYGDLIVPMSFAIGVLLTCYGLYMRRRMTEAPTGEESGDFLRPIRQDAQFDAKWRVPLTKVLVGLLVTLSLFWEVSNYAQVVGRGLGVRIASNLGRLTGVTLYSPQRLQIGAPGVTETQFKNADSPDRFRYRGLLLLQYTGGKYFLLSDGWSPEQGVVLVIPDDARVRLEFSV